MWKTLLVAGAKADDGPDDLRDDVAGALDDDGVADADVLAMDVVFVVERREADGGAADVHGLEDGVGVEAAGAADVDADVEELRRRLDGRELVGDGPARLASDEAKALLEGEVVDLDDDAVDFVWEAFALAAPLVADADRVVDAGHALDCSG